MTFPADSLHRTRIKICGITRVEDALAAAEAGADAIGLVFYPKSPRCVTLSQAASIARALPPFVSTVALFVNAAQDTVRDVIDAVRPAMLQFHGDETPAACALAGHPYLRAARMRPGLDLLDFKARYADAKALLLDAYVEAYGGGGEVFDWSLIPKSANFPIVLSGGLHASNVGRAIAQVRPWAVDVSSGVELAKGVKDASAIRSFVAAVRDADAAAQG
ncbi:MAG: N-(5'-phosphoribosyl)anthranilate isomerase [Thiomonas sp. 15-66-11]|uniref:N-(5'-phosphoribosyl)anthranilate isomerase n=1 Tax=Thiomonas delicata TaxID=364030 RepID=A0A238D4N6_THIDL|nr:phosphoribosylanthranilate isomerase [Thiomonas delicata]OZB44742.1 MAG: N-(5'-phosphoribosyl)anthranilate isomerase [Thiomonas sp. 15-66-11]SBP88169.1 N-(5'-phosphoribosyl)anthranilate isomerase (PRAI) [Thiomonas delicata]